MLPLSITVYYLINNLKKYRLGLLYLFILSLFFVGFMNAMYLWILLADIMVNYAFGSLINGKWIKGIDENKKAVKRKTIFIVGIVLNILVLFVFKYFDFFKDNFNAAFNLNISSLNLILPLGISFYTFQQIGYLTECYCNEERRYDFLEYALYISFFPKFTQGPIIMPEEIIPQFSEIERKKPDYENLSKGLYRFILGLSKKVLIADNIGKLVDAGYLNVTELTSLSAILIILAYTLQIYFDFSGYSDMAIGVGHMLNIDLPENFDSPYKANSISDFWNRWHITLTKFLTKYVYIPLGGNRKGVARTYINVLLVFLVSGFWHGASWGFIIWGVLHGIAMSVKRLLNMAKIKIGVHLERAMTFIFVSIAWVFFRATEVKDAITLLKRVICGGMNGFNYYVFENFNDMVLVSIIKRLDVFKITDISEGSIAIVVVFVTLCMCFLGTNTGNISNNWKPGKWRLISAILLGILCVINFSGVGSYIYWNF